MNIATDGGEVHTNTGARVRGESKLLGAFDGQCDLNDLFALCVSLSLLFALKPH